MQAAYGLVAIGPYSIFFFQQTKKNERGPTGHGQGTWHLEYRIYMPSLVVLYVKPFDANLKLYFILLELKKTSYFCDRFGKRNKFFHEHLCFCCNSFAYISQRVRPILSSFEIDVILKYFIGVLTIEAHLLSSNWVTQYIGLLNCLYY